MSMIRVRVYAPVEGPIYASCNDEVCCKAPHAEFREFEIEDGAVVTFSSNQAPKAAEVKAK